MREFQIYGDSIKLEFKYCILIKKSDPSIKVSGFGKFRRKISGHLVLNHIVYNLCLDQPGIKGNKARDKGYIET